MSLSRAQFVERLTASGIFSAADVAEFERKVAAARETSDAQAYARLLVQHGKLTKYQAAALYQGKTKGLVLGNYVLLDKLGAGGMGQVFKALHRRMERVVALKVLPAEATKSPENVKRFHREVKAAARLEHPNIVAAHDADEADGTHFLVMQYVEGKDLSALVKEHGPFPVTQAVECIRQAAQGLAYAHKRGVIHRDIKPANLLLDSEGTVKILDMGLARLEGQLHDAASVAGLTQSGQVMGTVDYMSPEQAEETRGVDARADQYSLGCTLWVLLTGRPMFGGTTTIAKLMAHRTAPIPALRAARADVSEALEAVYRKMVAKEPDERYQSMEEVIAALVTCLGDAPPSSLDGPSSTDSRLTEFFQQIAGAKTAAPPRSVTAVDEETIQRQPVKEETGTQYQPVSTTPDRQFAANQSLPTATSASLAAAKPVPKAKPAPAAPPASTKRKLHPLALAAGLAVAGIGGLGVVLALVLWFVLPREESTTASTDGANQVESPPAANDAAAASRPIAAGLQFDGIASHVLLRAALKLPASEPATIEAIVTPHDSQQSGIVVITPEHRGGTIFAYNGKWVARAWVVGEANYSESSLAIDDSHIGKPIHLASVSDGTRVVLYVNGKPGVAQQIVAVEDNKLQQIMLGGAIHPDGKPGWNFDGILHQVRISNSKRYGEPFTSPQQLKNDADTLALYHFDEGAGDVLHDVSRNKHDAKIVGAKWVPDSSNASGPQPADYALEFDGKSSYVQIPSLHVPAGPFTVEARVRLERGTTASIIKGFGAQPFVLFSDTGLALQISSQNAPRRARHDLEFGPARWRQVAAVWDGSEARLYVDGQPAPLADDAADSQGPDGFTLGAEPRNGFPGQMLWFFKGAMDEMRVSKIARYDRPYQTARRLRHDEHTLALYHFDEGEGQVLLDSSGNKHDGKIVGAKWIALASAPVAPAAASPGGWALEFGDGQYVDIPSLAYDDGPVTLEAWVTPTEKEWQGVVMALHNRETSQIYYHNENWHAARIFRPGTLAEPALQVAQVERRDHVAFVWDGAKQRLFVNGKPTEGESLGGANEVRAKGAILSGVWIEPAHNGLPSWTFRGRMDEVRISKTARYDREFVPQPQQPFATDSDTLALYHFDEGQGDVLRDSSGHSHHGKIVGAKWVSVAPRDAASAIQFSPEDRVELPPLPLAGLGEMCVEAWVTPRQQSEREAVVFNAERQAGLKVNPNGNWDVVVSNGQGQWHSLGSPQQAVVGRLTHVAGTLRANRVALYVDGQRVAYKPATNFRLGDKNQSAVMGGGWNGSIHALRVSKVARYDENFTPSRNLTSDTDTIALYHCDEGAGDVLDDSSGNNHDGKIVGAKWLVASGSRASPDAPPADYALKFNGQSLVDIPSLERDVAQPLTIEAWVKDVADHTGVLACVRGKYPVQMHISNGHFLSGGERLPEAKLWRGFATLERIDFSSWTHVAYVIDEQGATLFVDGKKDREFSKAGYAPPWTVAYHPGASIGGDAGVQGKPAWTLRGSVRELRFSNSARYDRDFTPQPRFSADATTFALYHFDEGEGDVLHDASGNEHDGKIEGASWVRADERAGPATFLHFSGDKQYVRAANFAYDGSHPITLELWTRIAAPRDAHVLHLPGPRAVSLGCNAGIWNFFRFDGEKGDARDAERPTPLGKWTHVAGVWDGVKMTLFVDGVPQAGKVHGWTGEQLGQGLFLGGEPLAENGGHDRFFVGDIGPLRVSRVARYTKTFTPETKWTPDVDTMLLFHTNEGARNTLRDASGKGMHGAIVGAKWVTSAAASEPVADYSLSFDGNDRIEIPGFAWNGKLPLTVEARVNSRFDTPYQKMLVHFLGNGSCQMHYDPAQGWLGIAHNGSGPTTTMLAAPLQVKQGPWHVAMVLEASGMKLFENGKFVSKSAYGMQDFTKEMTPSTSLGAQYDSSRKLWNYHLQGTLDEVRFSKIARYSEAEKYTPAARLTSDEHTLALYHFDDGAGDVLRDSSGNERHGKIVGAKWVRVALSTLPSAEAADD